MDFIVECIGELLLEPVMVVFSEAVSSLNSGSSGAKCNLQTLFENNVWWNSYQKTPASEFLANDQGRTTNNQLDVGRQCDNRFRILVRESRLAPNIGLERSF